MKKLNVVVTAGGTREYLDDVRVLTNISTGKLGSRIAQLFIDHGHNVTYVAPLSACTPSDRNYQWANVTNTESVMDTMERLVPLADVVIHSMAVSDFTFNIEAETKLSSDSAEDFVEHIRKTIVKTPKVISHFREWNPNAILIGFKFTVGKDKKELIQIANKLMEDNKLDMVFANDKSQMQKAGEHLGTLIMKDWSESICSKDEIAKAIYANVVRVIGGRA